MHPRIPLAFLAARAHCWIMVNLSSTNVACPHVDAGSILQFRTLLPPWSEAQPPHHRQSNQNGSSAVKEGRLTSASPPQPSNLCNVLLLSLPLRSVSSKFPAASLSLLHETAWSWARWSLQTIPSHGENKQISNCKMVKGTIFIHKRYRAMKF